jgi:hypothetical protein
MVRRDAAAPELSKQLLIGITSSSFRMARVRALLSKRGPSMAYRPQAVNRR